MQSFVFSESEERAWAKEAVRCLSNVQMFIFSFLLSENLIISTMKVIAALIATLSLASAFAPISVKSRASTQVNALFDDVRGRWVFGAAFDTVEL